jgi:hypothetical protein
MGALSVGDFHQTILASLAAGKGKGTPEHTPKDKMVYVIQGFFFFSVFFWDLNSQKLGRGFTT